MTSDPTRELIPPAYRTKVVEPIARTTIAQRERLLHDAGHNVFHVPASSVAVDLLTDSGTGAMSAAQWGSMFTADESYAGAASFDRFRGTVSEITGFAHVLPTHQGRAAEKLLMRALVQTGDVVPGNGHFDTTRAHIEALGASALDLPCAANARSSTAAPFKGNINVNALADVLSSDARVPLVLITITSNRAGGQPVSLDNLHETAALCREANVPLFLDAARFAENAALAQRSDVELNDSSPAHIARAYFDLAAGCTMSAKKDGHGNIGGFLALRDAALAKAITPSLILDEGFITYGGLAGRDLDAIAIGLREALEPDYLRERLHQVDALWQMLHALNIPLVAPAGGHAVFIDAGRWLAHIPWNEYPGQSLVAALYRTGGVRACELGSLMFGLLPDGTERRAEHEFVRLAIPRRVYGHEHMCYVAETFARVAEMRQSLRGFRVTSMNEPLRHFMAKLAPL
ncbi:MAG: tryptophanase [Sandaracinaceae bacterium]|jgi:tyrosine phenol-lyase|nr:tryptophanase [Sandaracinaceae bacterium]